MGRRPLFHVFGIPVSIEPWFLFGLVLFYSISGGGRAGLFTVIALAIFVLVHELGHAVVARRFGADVAITLNFMVGWASYARREPLPRWKSNLISLAGPLTQLVVATGVFWGVEKLLPVHDNAAYRLQNDLLIAVMWAGMVLAVLNLLPIWPLDGGHIVDSLIESRFGAAGRRLFFMWSVAVSGVMLVFGLTNSSAAQHLNDWTNDRLNQALNSPPLQAVGHIIVATPAVAMTSAVFIAVFCGLSSLSALQGAGAGFGVGPARSRRPAMDPRLVIDEATVSKVRAAERQGWSFGAPGEFPPGWVPSPWLRAHLALLGGTPIDDAAQELLGLAAPRQNWVVDRYDRPEIGRLLDHVPPMVAASPGVVTARVYQGPGDQLISAALEAFHGDPGAEGFYVIAEGLALRNDPDEAMSWLTRAVREHPDARRVKLSRPLSALHGRSDFQQLLGEAERAETPQPRR